MKALRIDRFSKGKIIVNKCLFLIVAFLVSPLCLAQPVSASQPDEELELLRRQVEALEEQNKLLKQQMGTPQTEHPKKQAQAVNEKQGLHSLEQQDEQVELDEEFNEPTEIRLSPSNDLREFNTWLDENYFGYKTVAAALMLAETKACVQVMDMAYEGVKSDESFEEMFGWKPEREDRWSVQQKIIDGRKAFLVFVAEGIRKHNIDNVTKMLSVSNMSLTNPKSEVSELLGFGGSDTALSPEQEKRMKLVVESFFAEVIQPKFYSPNAQMFLRCGNTMPNSHGAAKSRFSDWQTISRHSLKGNFDKLRSFDSVLVDSVLLFEDYLKKHGISWQLEASN